MLEVTLCDFKLSSSKILELKAKSMGNEAPPDERERELDNIVDKHCKTKQSQLLNEEQENAYVVNLYKIGSTGTLRASNLQLKRIQGFLDKAENMYDIQEKVMREASKFISLQSILKNLNRRTTDKRE